MYAIYNANFWLCSLHRIITKGFMHAARACFQTCFIMQSPLWQFMQMCKLPLWTWGMFVHNCAQSTRMPPYHVLCVVYILCQRCVANITAPSVSYCHECAMLLDVPSHLQNTCGSFYCFCHSVTHVNWTVWTTWQIQWEVPRREPWWSRKWKLSLLFPEKAHTSCQDTFPTAIKAHVELVWIWSEFEEESRWELTI